MATASHLEPAMDTVRPGTPWLQRLGAVYSLGPVALGVGVFAFQCLGLAITLWIGSEVPSSVPDAAAYLRGVTGSNLLMALLTGYAVTALGFAVRAQTRAVDEVRPLLDVDGAAAEEACEKATAFPVVGMRTLGSVNVVILGALIVADPVDMGPWPRPDLDQPILWWVVWANAVLGWHVSRLMYYEINALSQLSLLGSRHARIDLWDRRPLQPFVRRGLESVLLVAIGASLLSLQIVGGWASPLVPGVIALMAVWSLVVFLLPVLGVHGRIRDAKWRRLDGLHAEIRRLEGALEAADPVVRTDAAGRLPALLALRESVHGTREWPIDVPALGRFGLYVAIGLGSWLGAALVERALGLWLD